jgi:type IV pilus assembly protein PilY1
MGNVRLYFGTGDREHPLNRAVTDRIYGLIDKGQTSPVTETKLLDFTADLVQNGTGGEYVGIEIQLNTAANPTDTTLYGWYIKLDAGDRTPAEVHPGEKVLAPVTVANGVVYITTYQPTINNAVVDPCSLGNLGTARLYAVDYWFGAAVYNFDKTNDSLYNTYKSNPYATHTGASGATSGDVFLRTDRHVDLGSGIPSGIVYTPPALLIGCGGGICAQTTLSGGSVLPLFWRQRN